MHQETIVTLTASTSAILKLLLWNISVAKINPCKTKRTLCFTNPVFFFQSSVGSEERGSAINPRKEAQSGGTTENSGPETVYLQGIVHLIFLLYYPNAFSLIISQSVNIFYQL